MIEGLLFGFGIIGGLGVWFSGAGLGASFFLGSVLIPLTLFLGTTILGINLSWVGWVIVLFAVIGYLKASRHFNLQWKHDCYQYLAHPIFVLPALILIVGSTGGESTYLLWSFDEFSSWGSWAKQIFVADTSWREDMTAIYRNYPKGWPMVIAFAQLPFTGFDELRGIAFLALFHVAFLALSFDVIRCVVEKETNISKKVSFLFAWSTILILLLVEVSWKLLPPSLLIERPVLYWSLGLFVLAFLAWYKEKSRTTIFIGMGLTLASALALKTPATSLIIPAALIGLIYWKSQENKTEISFLKFVTYLFLPVVITAVSWVIYSQTGKVSLGFRILLDENSVTKFFALSTLIKEALLSYIISYKSPLTGLGLIGLFSAFWFPKQRAIVAVMLIYILLSWMALWPLYIFNIGGSEYEVLPSFQRYARLPIRMVHFFGLVFLTINLFTYLKLKNFHWSQLILKEKSLIRIGFLTILMLGSFQVWSLDRSYLDMGLRDYGSTTTDLTRAKRIREFRRQSEGFNSLIKKLNLSTPTTLFISQGGNGFVERMAKYYSITDQKNSKIHLYHFQPGWSWGPESTNQWMRKTTNKKFGNLISSSDIIWPHKLDSWSIKILSNYIDDKNCRQNLTKYFVVKTRNNFKCYFKFPR